MKLLFLFLATCLFILACSNPSTQSPSGDTQVFARIQGHLLESYNVPVGNNSVTLLLNGNPVASDTTDSLGAFTFDSLAAGTYALAVNASLSDTFSVDRGDTANIHFFLNGFITIVQPITSGNASAEIRMIPKSPFDTTQLAPDYMIPTQVPISIFDENCNTLLLSDSLTWDANAQSFHWHQDSLLAGTYCIRLGAETIIQSANLVSGNLYDTTIASFSMLDWTYVQPLTPAQVQKANLAGFYLDSTSNFDTLNYDIHGLAITDSGTVYPAGVQVNIGKIRPLTDTLESRLLLNAKTHELILQHYYIIYGWINQPAITYTIIGTIDSTSGLANWPTKPRTDTTGLQFHAQTSWMTWDKLYTFSFFVDRVVHQDSTIATCLIDSVNDEITIQRGIPKSKYLNLVAFHYTAIDSLNGIPDSIDRYFLESASVIYWLEGDVIYEFPVYQKVNSLILDTINAEFCRGRLNYPDSTHPLEFRLPVVFQ